jgi:hyperosmotically inducible protein
MKKIQTCLLSLALLSGLTFTAACSSTATRQSTGEYIDDTAVTAKVKSAFIKDDTVKAIDVKVETFRGVVQLSGFVDSSIQKDRAEQVARGVSGVRDVTNNIQLKANQNR